MQDIGAVLTGIAKRIRVLVLPGLPPKGDIVDWLNAGGTREALDQLINQTPDWQPREAAEAIAKKLEAEASEQQLLDELASLDRLGYERRRKEAAEGLGVRAGALDAEVAERRAQQQAETGPAPLFGHWIVEPWPEEVETDALLTSIERRVQRHVALSSELAITATLWALLAWVHDTAVVHSPLLWITSAEAFSGKTTLASLIGFMTPRALSTVNITEAALFRSCELWTPTLIATEADTMFADNEPLRAVINSGWTRGTGVLRCIGDERVPHLFPTFCPKVIDMLGRRLKPATLSRCIEIGLKRKLPNESREDFNHVDDSGLEELRRLALRWSMDNAETLRGAQPILPAEFQNRLRQNWKVQIAIADLAGGKWPDNAREVAHVVSGAADTTSRNVRLLADIKAIFDETPAQALSSAVLVAKLTANEDSEWAAMGKSGKPLTQNQLARMLKPFGIAPDNHVPIEGGGKVRGYHGPHFEDPWKRYLP
jgi:putative DNA primase/helicase